MAKNDKKLAKGGLIDFNALDMQKHMDCLSGMFFGRLDADNLPRKYIINENATILIWADNTKTIVRRMKKDKHDKRNAFLTAYFQKHSGLSKGRANKYLDELREEDEK